MPDVEKGIKYFRGKVLTKYDDEESENKLYKVRPICHWNLVQLITDIKDTKLHSKGALHRLWLHQRSRNGITGTTRQR